MSLEGVETCLRHAMLEDPEHSALQGDHEDRGLSSPWYLKGHDISKIVRSCGFSALEEAITLYEKLKRDAEEQTFRPEQAVAVRECLLVGEDMTGTVDPGDEVRCRMSNAKTSRAT